MILPALLLFFVLPTGLFLAFFVPPGQVPDEPAHLARMESLLHGEIIGQRRLGVDLAGRPIELSGVVINASPVEVMQLCGTILDQQKMTLPVVARLYRTPWANQLSFVDAPNTSVYFPVFYLPGAVGLAVARVNGLTPLCAILTARIVNLGSYILVAILALILTQRGRALIFATLTVPLTLWLAASCNQDGLLIACSCLIAALLTRNSGPKGISYWGAGVLLACVIAAKPGYLPLAAFMLTPNMSLGRREMLRGLSGVLVAGLPGIIWTLFMLHYVSGPFIWGPPYHPGPLWPGDPDRLFSGSDSAAQAMVFLHHPSLALVLPLRTLYLNWIWDLYEAVGVLGTLNVVMAPGMYHWWFAALALAAIGDLLASRQAADNHILLLLIRVFAIAATVVGIHDLEYLTWTKVGDGPLIDGIQGRYFLPLLPMIGIALPLLWRTRIEWLRGALVVPAVAMAAVGMIYLPILVFETYYL
jgi:hypothetical protein